jgi:hypothetical protein
MDPWGTGGVGHHYISTVVREQYKDSKPEVYEVFNKNASGPTSPTLNGADGHCACNKKVAEEFEAFLEKKGIQAKDLTDTDAQEFVDNIKASDVLEISVFLKLVHSRVISASNDAVGDAKVAGESVCDGAADAGTALGILGGGLGKVLGPLGYVLT